MGLLRSIRRRLRRKPQAQSRTDPPPATEPAPPPATEPALPPPTGPVETAAVIPAAELVDTQPISSAALPLIVDDDDDDEIFFDACDDPTDHHDAALAYAAPYPTASATRTLACRWTSSNPSSLFELSELQAERPYMPGTGDCS